jgi:medium-chain acyl-[acyl-carrier-protein] hydrolase
LNNWFHSFSPNPNAELRLFCFHYGGGGASTFRDWHEYLPEYVEPICVQFPGRELRYKEPLVSDLNLVCKQLNDAIKGYLNKPYLFFGHSVGALVSHHLAYRLKSEGQKTPEHIVISGRSAPSDDKKYYDKITHLPDEEFLEKLPEYGGTPESFLNNSELIKIYLPILRSDFLLSESEEKIIHKLDCPISVFGGFKDRVSSQKLQLWKNETTQECNVTMFPGNHFFINENKIQVINQLKKIITALRERE